MAHIDEIAPAYIGEDRIRLTLDEDLRHPRAHALVVVHVDYVETMPQSVVLPLEVTVTRPNGQFLLRRVERRRAPATVAFTPREGGAFLVRVAEIGHNRWWGRLRVDVAGDTSVRRGEA